MTKQYGLLGYPLSHSFSPGFFQQKFNAEQIDAQYKLFETTDPVAFFQKAKQSNLSGFNITSPYKEAVIPYLDEMEHSVSFIGACNCVRVAHGKLIGYNTDVYGFSESLRPLLQSHHSKALILGSGGASKAVHYALTQLNILSLTVSRFPNRGHITYNQLNSSFLRNYPLIIHTTPLGTHPSTHLYPSIPYTHLSAHNLCFDLVYNPAKTQFLSLAETQGAIIKNGLEMLHLQAEKSWEIWNQ